MLKGAVTLAIFALAEAALAASPQDLDAIHDVASGEFQLGDLMTYQGEYEKAIKLRERGLELFQRLAAADPSNVEKQRSVAVAEKKLAALYGVTKRYQESLSAYQKAREIDEQRLGLNPTTPRTKLDLSFDYSDLGWVTSRINDDVAALEWHRKALALRREAAKADPNDSRAASALVSSIGRIATVLRRLGKLEEALDMANEAAGLWKARMEKAPTSAQVAVEWADVRAEIGYIKDCMAMRSSTPAAKRNELFASSAQEFDQIRATYIAMRDKGTLPKNEYKYIDQYADDAAKARAHQLNTHANF